jgi:hypothetical protein
MPDPFTHEDAQRLLDVLQGLSRGLLDIAAQNCAMGCGRLPAGILLRFQRW